MYPHKNIPEIECGTERSDSLTLRKTEKAKAPGVQDRSVPAFLSSSFKICFLFTNVIKGTPPQLCPALSVNDERGRRLGKAVIPNNPLSPRGFPRRFPRMNKPLAFILASISWINLSMHAAELKHDVEYGRGGDEPLMLNARIPNDNGFHPVAKPRRSPWSLALGRILARLQRTPIRLVAGQSHRLPVCPNTTLIFLS